MKQAPWQSHQIHLPRSRCWTGMSEARSNYHHGSLCLHLTRQYFISNQFQCAQQHPSCSIDSPRTILRLIIFINAALPAAQTSPASRPDSITAYLMRATSSACNADSLPLDLPVGLGVPPVDVVEHLLYMLRCCPTFNAGNI